MRAAACHGLFLSKRSKGAKKLGFKIDSDQHILRNLILRIHVHVLRIPEIMSLKAMIRAVTEAHAGAMCKVDCCSSNFQVLSTYSSAHLQVWRPPMM